jgi:hypothetical protein
MGGGPARCRRGRLRHKRVITEDDLNMLVQKIRASSSPSLELLILLSFKKASSRVHRERLGVFGEAQIWRGFQWL